MHENAFAYGLLPLLFMHQIASKKITDTKPDMQSTKICVIRLLYKLPTAQKLNLGFTIVNN